MLSGFTSCCPRLVSRCNSVFGARSPMQYLDLRRPIPGLPRAGEVGSKPRAAGLAPAKSTT